MAWLRSLLASFALALVALGAAAPGLARMTGARRVQPQVAQPGAPDNGVLTPASAAPQASSQPNLRTDSKPRSDASPATDSGPVPESLGQDQQVPPDLGLDFSSLRDNQRGFTEIFSSKGVTRIPEAPVVPLPVSNPPEPSSTILTNIAMPPVRRMPTPPDPSPKPHSPEAEASSSPQ